MLGAIKVVFTLISLSIVDRIGRRSLLLCGAGGMAFSLLALSAAFDKSNGDQNGALSPTQTDAALVSVCCAVAFYSLGFGPVTWLVVSELFPDEYRGRAIGETVSLSQTEEQDITFVCYLTIPPIRTRFISNELYFTFRQYSSHLHHRSIRYLQRA